MQSCNKLILKEIEFDDFLKSCGFADDSNTIFCRDTPSFLYAYDVNQDYYKYLKLKKEFYTDYIKLLDSNAIINSSYENLRYQE